MPDYPILKHCLSPLSNSDRSKPIDSSSAWSHWRLLLPNCSRRPRCWSSSEGCAVRLWANNAEVCNAVAQADQLHLCCQVDQTLSVDVVSSFALQEQKVHVRCLCRLQLVLGQLE
ncbi:unnamed protein product [Effrenium voratum]|nr:unnamed protein product [Effrenium voratum]